MFLGITSTVTTSTITTVTTTGIVAGLGVICTLALIGFLVLKEIAGSGPGDSGRGLRWSRILNIGVIPLLFAFAVIVAGHIAQAL